METNNLTPDENLKCPTDYNPYNDYDEIIHPTFRDEEDNSGLVYGESMSDEEFSDSGFGIIYLFTGLLAVAVGIVIYYIYI